MRLSFWLAPILPRAGVQDALIARHGLTLATLPCGAVVGTSSVRRQAQLLAVRPDLTVRSIRGNVDTRLRKVAEGQYDATVLAGAGLQRLGLADSVSEWLSFEMMLPAPGQGAIAVQCRADDVQTLQYLHAIEDMPTRLATSAEREFLRLMGGGCSAPIAALADVENIENPRRISMSALVATPDGRRILRVQGENLQGDGLKLAAQLAAEAMVRGAREILFGEAQNAVAAAVEVAARTVADKRLPLAGKRIVVTRAAEQADEFSRKLAVLGAIPIEIPAIRIAAVTNMQAVDEAIHGLNQFDRIVFTSSNGVEIFFRRLAELNHHTAVWQRPRVAAVGTATVAALHTHGVPVDFIPETFVGEKIATGLGTVAGVRILLPRAEIASRALPNLLNQQGADVVELPIYRTIPADLDPEAVAGLQQGVDAITFTSGSTARNFVAAVRANADDLPAILDKSLIACIGPVMADVAQELGCHVDIVAETHTTEGLIQALVTYFMEENA